MCSEEKTFALKGTILTAPAPGTLRVWEGYTVCENGVCAGCFEELPAQYAGVPVRDFTGRLILPGLADLHLHAPQYMFCGTAMDLELLAWLQRYTYPEEAKYADLCYAERAYGIFVEDLLHSATTRACVFATLHTEATLLLMRRLEAAGLAGYVGKVSMDRNSPDDYREPDAAAGLARTRAWLDACGAAGFSRVKPMITPRFTPSVTDAYMEGLGRLAAEYGLPAQSHLSENKGEIAWVKELCPDSAFYGETYARWGLFGGACPTVMAHCIHCPPEEASLLRKNGVMIAHCPTSNENVIAGIAPAARYLRGGWRIGLGTDVAGGHTLDLFRVMAAAVQVSKLRWRCVDDADAPLTMAEAFWLATAGGGAFFGKVGQLAPGYEFDAVVVDDSALRTTRALTPAERLERWAYRGNGTVCAKYVQGARLF